MSTDYTAVVMPDGESWIGWVKEIPGVCSRGHSRDELLGNLRSALKVALEMNLSGATAADDDSYEEVRISV